jgi:hypothetical protein
MLSFEHLLHISDLPRATGSCTLAVTERISFDCGVEEVKMRRDFGTRGMMMLAVMSVALAVAMSVAVRMAWGIVAE